MRICGRRRPGGRSTRTSSAGARRTGRRRTFTSTPWTPTRGGPACCARRKASRTSSGCSSGTSRAPSGPRRNRRWTTSGVPWPPSVTVCSRWWRRTWKTSAGSSADSRSSRCSSSPSCCSSSRSPASSSSATRYARCGWWKRPRRRSRAVTWTAACPSGRCTRRWASWPRPSTSCWGGCSSPSWKPRIKRSRCAGSSATPPMSCAPR